MISHVDQLLLGICLLSSLALVKILKTIIKFKSHTLKVLSFGFSHLLLGEKCQSCALSGGKFLEPYYGPVLVKSKGCVTNSMNRP